MKKHRGSSKIKFEHHIIEGLRPLLEKIQKWPEIKAINPGEIKRSSYNSGKLNLKVQYKTASGIKCLAKSSSGRIQEVFIVSHDADTLIKKLSELKLE
jgi:hypothetical protein